MNVFVFDIETIPDTENGARLFQLDNLSPQEIAQAMAKLKCHENQKNAFLPHHLHKIVAISAVLNHNSQLSVWSLGDEASSEKDLIERFFAGVNKFTPQLVSWNGSGFDLPVLHYRALLHGVPAASYWESGEHEQSFRYNNYLNRYHARHVDLMDVLSAYQLRASAPLTEIATLLGFPGKMGMDGSKVFGAYLDGDIKSIRDYCETDVLNTYLVYLRFELMRANLTHNDYLQECERVKTMLAENNKPHCQAFLEAWKKND